MMAFESSVISGEGLPSGSCVGRWPTAMILRSGEDQATIFLRVSMGMRSVGGMTRIWWVPRPTELMASASM